MNKYTKIIIGYTLAVILFTVLILSIRVQLHKNVEENFLNKTTKFVFGIPITIFFIYVLLFLAFALCLCACFS